MRFRKYYLKLLSLTCLFSVVNSTQCGAVPDIETAHGVCILNPCESAIIGSNEMKILPFSESIEVKCHDISPNEDYLRPIPIKFMFQKPKKVLPTETLDPGEEETEEIAEEEQDSTPVPGISFEAYIVSGETAEIPNVDSPDPKYSGIVTPIAEWCTDSCGVGSIEFVPKCKADENKINIMVRSGSVHKVVEVKVVP